MQLIIFSTSPIDKIISLGDATFRFITFATSINEDMIVITSSTKSSTDEVYKKRILFGLKKSGRYYFENNDGEETPFISLIAEYSYPKLQSESCFLFYTDGGENNGKRYLFSLAAGDSTVEIYDLQKPYSISVSLGIAYYARTVISLVSSIFKSSYRTDDKYYYVLAHSIKSSTDIPIYIFRDYFDEPIISKFNGLKGGAIESNNKNAVSCYETQNYVLICLYQNLDNHLQIYELDLKTGDIFNDILCDNTFEQNNLIFFKGIHLKGEIGVFMYYESLESTNPLISIKEYIENTGLRGYNSFNKIEISEIDKFNSNLLLNDFLRVSDDKICIVSASTNKNKLYLVILNLLDNDNKMLINYYEFNMADLSHKIYLDIKLHLYNDNYITLGFSHCITDSCTDTDISYSSLIIFNYPNGNDTNLNLIEFLNDNSGDIEELNINLSDTFNIENNIFG